MKKIFSTLFILGIILFASCGEGYDAKSRVREFMKEQMALSDYDVIAWSNVDSTFRVTDSMLTVMRTKASKERVVKGNAGYAKKTPKLNLITVKYAVGKDTMMNTFYLDEKLTGVVAVKKDVFGTR